MDRLRFISRPLSTSIHLSSKYRYGKHDLSMPKFPKQNKVGQNIIRVEGNHRLRLESIAVKQKRYLERGAAQDYSAEMTAEYGIIATGGFRLTAAQMNAMHLALNQQLNKSELKFKEMGAQAYWRLPEPWLPVIWRVKNTTRGGQQPPIQTWVSPVRARQIVLEVDVDCDYEHIYPILLNTIKSISGEKFDMNKGFGYAENKMMPISKTNLIKMYEEERKIEMANENFFTTREIYAKNMGGIRNNYDKWQLEPNADETLFHSVDGVGSGIHRTYKGLYR